jgi:hypothetical protein
MTLKNSPLRLTRRKVKLISLCAFFLVRVRFLINNPAIVFLDAQNEEQGLKYLEYVYDAKVMLVNEVIREIVK